MSAASPVPLVVKLGGSVLTRKGEDRRARPKVIQRLASELAEGLRESPQPLLLVHGAGSFGHPAALKYRLSQAPSKEGAGAGRARGAALTAWGVRELHQSVLRALLDVGLPVFSVPPFPMMENRQGRFAGLSLAPFERILAGGGIPVTFGDVVLDEGWGFAILSGDTLVGELARGVGSRRALFVSDVPGVLEDRRPGPMRIVRTLSDGTVESLTPTPGVPDVTGGLRGKVSVMLDLARQGVSCGLISGLTPGLVSRALQGEEVYGSWARPS